MKIRKRNRHKYFDYSNAGWYYVTICTNNHKEYFGKVLNDRIVLNSTGEIVNYCWENIAALHKHIELDDYVIMPNHIHGIIIINFVEDANPTSFVVDANFASTTVKFASDDRTKMELSKLIQQFKRAATIKIKSAIPGIDFKWQRSFYDRIIRNEKELFYIRRYIQQNPLKWNLEKSINNIEL